MNDEQELEPKTRDPNDTTPLFALVRDVPHGNGRVTSAPRTMSPQYIAFLERNRRERKQKRG